MENSCNINPRPKTVKELFRSWYFWKPALSIIVGGIAGFLYYHFVGCSSGQCALTGSPISSTLFGAFFGYFIVNSPCASGKC